MNVLFTCLIPVQNHIWDVFFIVLRRTGYPAHRKMKIMFNLRNIWSDKIFPFPKIKPHQLHREFHWKREERHVLNCKKEIIYHIYFWLSGIGESVIFKLFFRISWQIIGIKYKQESKNSNTYLHTHGMTNPFNHLYNHIFIIVDIKSIYTLRFMQL